MTLPPHTASPCGIPGYERIDWTPPSVGLPEVAPVKPGGMTRMAPGGFGFARPVLSGVNRDDPEFHARCRALAASQAALKPWTLLAMPGDAHSLIARRRTLWMRVVTWWHNRRRRREAEEQRRRMAAYFSPEQVAARARASQ